MKLFKLFKNFLPYHPPWPLQEESFQVPGTLQNGCQSICFHSHSLCDEGIRLAPGEGVQLCEAKAQYNAP